MIIFILILILKLKLGLGLGLGKGIRRLGMRGRVGMDGRTNIFLDLSTSPFLIKQLIKKELGIRIPERGT